MADTNPWFILALIAAALVVAKKTTLLSRSGLSKPSPASPPSTARQPITSLSDVPDDELGMEFARRRKESAENRIMKGILDGAGKTIEDAFSAPFSVADPGKDKPEDIPL